MRSFFSNINFSLFFRGSVQLEEELSLLQLKKLMRLFKQHKPEQKYKTFSYLRSRDVGKPGLMNLDEFNKALNKAVHDRVLASEMEELFRKVDISSDGLVDWEELSSYILLRLQERELLRSSSSGKVFQNPPKIVKIEKCKVMILRSSSPEAFPLHQEGCFSSTFKWKVKSSRWCVVAVCSETSG
jgi:hypothetical protein